MGHQRYMTQAEVDLLTVVLVVKGWGVANDSEALWVAKGAGHKYLRRVPYVDAKGKRRYRYFYNVHHSGGIHNTDHMQAGAAFKHGDGHYHVTHDHGDGHVTVRHDETGHEHKIHRDELSKKLREHHKEDLDKHVKRIRGLHEASKHNSYAKRRWKGILEKLGHKVAEEKKNKLAERAAAATPAERQKRVEQMLAKKAERERQAAEAEKARKVKTAEHRARAEAAAEGEKPRKLGGKVESSNIGAVQWEQGNGQAGKMRVQFKNGSVYEYEGVTREQFNAIHGADSVGKAYAAFRKRAPGSSKKIRGATPKKVVGFAEAAAKMGVKPKKEAKPGPVKRPFEHAPDKFKRGQYVKIVGGSPSHIGKTGTVDGPYDLKGHHSVTVDGKELAVQTRHLDPDGGGPKAVDPKPAPAADSPTGGRGMPAASGVPGMSSAERDFLLSKIRGKGGYSVKSNKAKPGSPIKKLHDAGLIHDVGGKWQVKAGGAPGKPKAGGGFISEEQAAQAAKRGPMSEEEKTAAGVALAVSQAKQSGHIDAGHHIQLDDRHQILADQHSRYLGVSAAISNALARADRPGLYRMRGTHASAGNGALAEYAKLQAGHDVPVGNTAVRREHRRISQKAADEINNAIRPAKNAIRMAAEKYRAEHGLHAGQHKKLTRNEERALDDANRAVDSKRFEHALAQLKERAGGDLPKTHSGALEYIASRVMRSGKAKHSVEDLDQALHDGVHMGGYASRWAGHAPESAGSDPESRANAAARGNEKARDANREVAELADKLGLKRSAERARAKADEHEAQRKYNVGDAAKHRARKAEDARHKAAQAKAAEKMAPEAAKLRKMAGDHVIAATSKDRRRRWAEVQNILGSKPGPDEIAAAKEHIKAMAGGDHKPKALPGGENLASYKSKGGEDVAVRSGKKHGAWGVHAAKGGGHQITHLPSGLSAGWVDHRGHAEHLVSELHAAGHGDTEDPVAAGKAVVAAREKVEGGTAHDHHDHQKELAKVAKHSAALAEAKKAASRPAPQRFDVTDQHHDHASAAKRLAKIASSDDTRRSLTGMHKPKDRDHAVATDGHRLAIIPAKDMDAGNHDVHRTGKSKAKFAGMTKDEMFPDYSKIVPKDEHQDHHIADAEAVHALAKQAHERHKASGAKGNGWVMVHQHRGESKVTGLHSSPDVGTHHTGTHVMHSPRGAEVAGGGTMVALNAKYVMDALHGAKGAVRIGTSKAGTEHSPVTIHRGDGEQHLIMPMRDGRKLDEIGVDITKGREMRRQRVARIARAVRALRVAS